MIFEALAIPGAFLVAPEPREDARGHFARLWCRDEFAAQGIHADLVQASVSHNTTLGTLRGLHFQWPPSHEAKIVRCERGRIFDVLVDLRPDSPAFGRHVATVLDEQTRNALFVPAGVAHGFQTLDDVCDVHYMMTDFYRPELADGVRFDDAAFGIRWPRRVARIADRDRDYPDFDRAAHARRYAAACAAA